jgi:hypothetical protein
VSRVAAVLIAVAYVVGSVVVGETKWTAVLSISLLLPVMLIWFPRQIGQARNYMVNRQMIDQPTPPVLISLAGWFFLVGLPLIVYLNWRK